jgi:anti-sigma regulatory factor (Ser/Thr protein kinase)
MKIEDSGKHSLCPKQMPTPVIVVPRQFNGRTLATLAAEVAKHARVSWPPALGFDFAELAFIRPAGVVFLSNLVDWLNEKGTRVLFQNTTKQTPPLFYLDDALFFQQHLGSKLRPTASPRSTTLPLLRLAQKDSHTWLQSNLLPWLALRLSINEASLYSVKVCISELFNNIQDHTRYDIGSIFIQHFPNENCVIFSIADFGLGIPDKVRSKISNLSDADAIVKAVEEGFTTKSTPANQGSGLAYLLETIVQTNNGEVTFYSGRSIVRFENKRNIVSPRVLSSAGFCPGSTIDIKVRTDTIEVLPDEVEELQW